MRQKLSSLNINNNRLVFRLNIQQLVEMTEQSTFVNIYIYTYVLNVPKKFLITSTPHGTRRTDRHFSLSI